MLRLGQCRDRRPPGKRVTGVEKDSGVKHAQAWGWQGWVTHWEERRQGEKTFRSKDAHAWAVQGWMTSFLGRRGYLYWLITDFG